MSVVRRRRWWALSGAGAVVCAAVALVVLSGPGPSRSSIRACPAVGYLNVSPVVLEASPGADVVTVAACLDGAGDCDPVPVDPVETGVWHVPQEPPFLTSEPGNVVRVTARAWSSEDVVVLDRSLDVGRVQVDGPGWSECPGPFDYEPVRIPG